MAEMNQCDGCRRGLPARDGNHYDGERPVMGCTASRYAPVAGADPRADGWHEIAESNGAALDEMARVLYATRDAFAAAMARSVCATCGTDGTAEQPGCPECPPRMDDPTRERLVALPAQPDEWRALADRCALAPDYETPPALLALLNECDAALRDAAEACETAQAMADLERGNHERAIAALDEMKRARDAAVASVAEGERGVFVAGYRRAAYVYSDQEENDADVTERAEREWSERQASRPSAGPAAPPASDDTARLVWIANDLGTTPEEFRKVIDENRAKSRPAAAPAAPEVDRG